MGTNSDNLPDPPWFPRPDTPFVPRLVALDKNRNPVDLPYLQYTLADDKPVLLGTQGHDQTVHHAELVAMLTPPPPFPSSIQDSNLELLYLDHPFNWAVNHALYLLGDAGVLADVHRYRMSYGHLRALKHKNEKLTRIIGAIQKEQEAHNLEIRTFTDWIRGIKKCLIDARVQTRLHPILARLSIEGMHQNPLYPYGTNPELPTNKELVEAAFQPPTLSQRPPTPIPPMRYPTPPNKPSGVLPTVQSPSPALEYSTEVFTVGQPLAAESPYLPITPTDPPTVERVRTPPSDRLSPRPDSLSDQGQSLSCTSSPDPHTLAIPPRVADYTAGNPRGPHHQPVLHDKPCSCGLHTTTWGLPLEVFMAGLRSQGHCPSFQAIPRPQCFYCTECSHRSAECPNPHEHCHQGQCCIVPCHHPQFSILCQYGGTHRRWQDQKGKALATPPLLTFDPDLHDVLAEDHFDMESDKEHIAKGEPLTPFEGTEDTMWYYTPEPDQEPTFWDNVLPRYISPTPPPQQQQQQEPSW